MSEPMIIVLSSPGDEHADHVVAMLEEHGAAFVRFDPGEFPSAASVTLTYATTGHRRSTLRLADREIDLTGLRAIWNRRPGLPLAHGVLAKSPAKEFVEEECRGFLRDLWLSLDCTWLPGAPAVVQRAGHKASQLRLAGELGFELPATVVTNDPAELLAFYRQHAGRVVSKPVANAYAGPAGNTFVRFTERVSPRDLAHAHALAYCPMIFQAYVPKRIELRITVVGRRVFAAEIHSQAANHTQLDWRRYDHHGTPHFVHDLPPDIARRCVALTERLGLCYGAIDMILTPDGRYVFLEINPNGQYLWIEDATGLPISAAICELLMSAGPVGERAPRRDPARGGVL